MAATGACAPDDACFAPRTGNETACEVFEPGGQWTINANEPVEHLDTLCEASCIDASSTTFVGVMGYSDLRKVPLLAKFRKIPFLTIDVEGLPDLRGLENVAIGDLTLSTHGKDMTTFHSLDGLGSALDSLSLNLLMGLTELDGARFTRLGAFSAEDSALERVSLASLTPAYVGLSRLDALTELSLGGGTVREIDLVGCSNLASFSWQPELKVQRFIIQNNSVLSSCLVQDFVSATAISPRGTTLVANNGPCP